MYSHLPLWQLQCKVIDHLWPLRCLPTAAQMNTKVYDHNNIPKLPRAYTACPQLENNLLHSMQYEARKPGTKMVHTYLLHVIVRRTPLSKFLVTGQGVSGVRLGVSGARLGVSTD